MAREKIRMVVERIWRKGRERLRKRIRTARRGRGKRQESQYYELGGVVRVKVGDEVLEKLDKKEPIRYGGVSTDREEDEILRLPANFKVTPPLRLEDIVTEIQAGGVRARQDEWTRWKEGEEQERLEGLRMRHQDPGMMLEDVTVSDNRLMYDPEEKKLKHRHMRPQQMPNHKGVELPGPMENRNMEVRLQMVIARV